jgi:hypothetical protein
MKSVPLHLAEYTRTFLKVGDHTHELPRTVTLPIFSVLKECPDNALPVIPVGSTLSEQEERIYDYAARLVDYCDMNAGMRLKFHSFNLSFYQVFSTLPVESYHRYLDGADILSNWLSHQSQWLTARWFVDHLAPLIYGKTPWVNVYPTDNTVAYTSRMDLVAYIISHHHDPKTVFEAISRVITVRTENAIIRPHQDVEHLSWERNIDQMPTKSQWQHAITDTSADSEYLFTLPPSLLVTLVSSYEGGS